MPHHILYICVIFGHRKWWKVNETERTPWSVTAGCDIRQAIIKLWIQQSAGNVFISCATALYWYPLTSNTMSELIIESDKNATIIVLRSGCEQQRHIHLDKTWQPQKNVTQLQLQHRLAQLFLICGSGYNVILTGTYTSPARSSHLEWLFVTLIDLAKYVLTWNIARSLWELVFLFHSLHLMPPLGIGVTGYNVPFHTC